MKISEYVKEYTSGRRFVFTDVLEECRELLVEVFKLNRAGIMEEAGDVVHFLQIWLYWRFGLDGELWKITNGSTTKIMNRISTWREVYKFVGLPINVSNYGGNYKRREKVILQLQRFGIDEKMAEQAYEKIVLKK